MNSNMQGVSRRSFMRILGAASAAATFSASANAAATIASSLALAGARCCSMSRPWAWHPARPASSMTARAFWAAAGSSARLDGGDPRPLYPLSLLGRGSSVG